MDDGDFTILSALFNDNTPVAGESRAVFFGNA